MKTGNAEALLGAIYDTWWAWRITPQRAAHVRYSTNQLGGWDVTSQAPYKFSRKAALKLLQSRLTFRRSMRLRLAQSVIIRRIATEGLVANILHVLEVLARMAPGARVFVDWTLTGEEEGFKYGLIGQNVWSSLFHPLGSAPTGAALVAEPMLEFRFWGNGKERLPGASLARLRYHKFATRLRVKSPRVRSEVNRIYDRRFRGKKCVAVHRRVLNAKVLNAQREPASPTIEELIVRARLRCFEYEPFECAVFLATDDVSAVGPFSAEFGERLIVRHDVQRTTECGCEVHYREWDALSLKDAEDVLIDALLLSRSDLLIHGSSSVSTFASILNPGLIMDRFTGMAGSSVLGGRGP